MPLTIAFDLDDTLVPAGHLYREAIWECGRIITRALGHRSPTVRKLMQFHEQLDIRLTEQFGYRHERFPKGWVQAYHHFCFEAGVEPDPVIESHVVRAAQLFMVGDFNPVPDAPAVLAELSRRGHRLHVVTRGERDLQERKLDQSGLRSLFASIHVVEIGTKHDALRALMQHQPGPFVMVGDGRRSDIRPAIDVGMHAVWFRGGDPWEHLDEALDPSLHYTIDSLPELVPLTERLEALPSARS